MKGARGGRNALSGRVGRVGQTTLEFILILAAFILPLGILAFTIQRYYRDLFDIISWFLSLPVP
jgi:hypothetical protein